jgi:hypothetical protein
VERGGVEVERGGGRGKGGCRGERGGGLALPVSLPRLILRSFLDHKRERDRGGGGISMDRTLYGMPVEYSECHVF